ncbi:class I adenylate-forming enzyme family protein [Paenibacillus sp. IITD108]|uniref:class I adenylate-forming enzyme family protein n=1 Tax=Paenibacillus sp. IITD108 TaxID=3116649 RepID=UPI002F40E942
MTDNTIILQKLFLKNEENVYLQTMDSSFTFYEFFSIINQIGTLLKNQHPERSLALISCKRPLHFIVSYFSCLIAGMVPVVCSGLLKSEEIHRLLIGKRLFLCDYPVTEIYGVSCIPYEKMPQLMLHYFPNGNNESVSDYNISVLIPTSGTFGKAKLVGLSVENIISNVEAIKSKLNLTSLDSTIAALPLHYSFAHTTQMWLQLYLSAKLVLTEGYFVPKLFYSLIEKSQPRTTGFIANHIHMLTTAGATLNPTAESLRTIVIAGGSTSATQMEKLQTLFPHTTILQGYGLTEASPRVSMETQGETIRFVNGIRSSGKPLPGVSVCIFKDDESSYSNSQSILLEEGIIGVKGPNLMVGYYNDPEETSKAIKNGWLFTNDIGFLDQDGYLYVRGRKNSMFVHKGYKIYPEEIESYVLEDNRIMNCLIQFKQTEQNFAYLMTIESDYTIEKLDIWKRLNKTLPYWKIPDEIIVGKVPVSANGKKVRKEAD